MSVVMVDLVVAEVVLVLPERKQGDLETPRQLLHRKVTMVRQIRLEVLAVVAVVLVRLQQRYLEA